VPYYRKLPSGKWQATVRHPAGHKLTKTDPLKRVVQSWATELETALRTGVSPTVRSQKLTLESWHEQWLRTRMVEGSTARKDAGRWRNHVQPYWGGWPLDAIQRSDVQEWVKKLQRGDVGPSAIEGAYELLSTMLGEAVDRKLLGATPCRRITLPRASKPEPRWLTCHEYDRLQLALGELTTVRGGRATVPDPNAPVYQALVALGCFSGLRPGELAGLDVSAVDFDRRLVRVTQVVTQVPDGPLPDGRTKYKFVVRAYPKSDRSIRSVPFPDEVGKLLWRIVADRTDGPVFTSPRGERVQMVGNFPNKIWHPALRAAGIEPVRQYVMRHTCASWLVQAGVPDRQIMAILGHADGHLIELYAHLAPDQHDEVRAAWGEQPLNSRRMGGARDLSGARAGTDNDWSEAMLDDAEALRL
jgi:integrase